MTGVDVWRLEDDQLAGETLAAIQARIAAGEIVILPTDTLYGLHSAADDADAVARIEQIKGREGKPFLVLCSDVDQLLSLGCSAAPDLIAFLRSVWPAALTCILPLERPIAASLGRASVAARVPDAEWLRPLLRATGPLLSTSVNRSGEPPAEMPGQIDPAVLSQTSGILDAGRLSGLPSTLVDFTKAPPEVIRQGRFHFTQNLWKTVRKTV